MAIKDGEFEKLTEDEIYQRFEKNLEDILGVTAEPGDLVKKQLQAEARTLAELYEEKLKKTYYAAYLEDAEGKELNKLVDLVGISRQEATGSTGTVQFIRDKAPGTDYIIPRGAIVQTGGSSPIEFETTEQTGLYYIDGFENDDLSEWNGDVASFSTINTSEMTGDYALEIPATDDVTIISDRTLQVGTTLEFDIFPDTDSTTSVLIGRQDSSNYYQAKFDVTADSIHLEHVKDGATISSSQNTFEIPTTSVSRVVLEWQLYGDLAMKVYETEYKENKIGEVFLDVDLSWNEGQVAIRSDGSTATALIDELATSAVTANVEALDTGIDTNIAPDAITNIKSGVSGINTVTNHVPTGDSKLQNTDFKPFVLGENVETDEELRERAFNNSSIGGAATSTAIGTRIEDVDGVQSVKIFKNKTENEKDGLPSHSFEPVVYGGKDKDVAEAIFNSSSIDSTDFGGAHGTESTYTVSSDVLPTDETVSWSRPDKYELNITLDLIVDDTYIGDVEIQSIIANYIGGTDTDGSFVPGVVAGENVYEAVLKQEIVSPTETGVWEVDSLTIDKDGDGTDDTTTTGSGADILSIADSEIAQVNSRDGSITINTTTK